MFEAGDSMDDFTIDEYLGSGHSADVYLVHRRDDPTPQALKILHPEIANEKKARERFEREFQIASLLRHPHIVRMYDRGELSEPFGSAPYARPAMRPSSSASYLFSISDTDTRSRVRPGPRTQPWISMQYVDGPSAAALVPDAHTEPDVPTVLRVGRQIAGALDYAHHEDIVHRDVKPSNILLDAKVEGGEAQTDTVESYLSDFGIARFLDDARPLALNGRVEASIAYAAPELLQAQHLLAQSDGYSFACTMMELLTGHPPFPRRTVFGIAQSHLKDDVPRVSRRRPWLPTALDAVFAKALAKSATNRYDSCTEFVDIIAQNLRDVPVPAPPRARRFGVVRRRA